MSTLLDQVTFVKRDYDLAATEAYRRGECPTCGTTVQFIVLARFRAYEQPPIDWVRCSNCRTGFAFNSAGFYGHAAGSSKPLSTPLGLLGDELAVWEEVRTCLQAGACTAAVMLCRKLLFHLAVTHGLPPKKDNGFAPGFAECVVHLEKEQIITQRMRPWVDRIKDVGNSQNHELEPISEEAALDVARFTEQLLKLAHEMDALMAKGAVAKSLPDGGS